MGRRCCLLTPSQRGGTGRALTPACRQLCHRVMSPLSLNCSSRNDVRAVTLYAAIVKTLQLLAGYPPLPFSVSLPHAPPLIHAGAYLHELDSCSIWHRPEYRVHELACC